MNSQLLNDILQIGGVVIVLGACLWWIVRRCLRKNSPSCHTDSDDPCSECSLISHCRKKSDAKPRRNNQTQ